MVMLAEMYAEDFYPERARRLWQQVLALEPQHPVARQQLAYLYEREGDMAAQWGNTKEALKIYEEGLRHLPDSQRLHIAIGRTCVRQRNLDQARHHFDQALAINPSDLSTLHDIFVIWLKQAAEADLQGIIDRIKAVTSPIPGGFFADLIHHCIETKQERLAKSLLDYTEDRYAEDIPTLLDLALLWDDLEQEQHVAALLRRVLKMNRDRLL
jgi:tetratricopeptide (TPR) repeat protein